MGVDTQLHSEVSALSSRRSMRFGCDRKHETYENIKRNGQVVVSLVAPPDNAVSIRGKARVAKSAWNL